MRLDIKNASTHPTTSIPIATMEELVGVQLGHFCNRWPGASHVVNDLIDAGYYLQLENALPEAPGALGYHDVDAEGRPYARVGVDLSLEHGSDWLTGAYSIVSIVGHEALETVGDPIINIWRDVDQHSETAQEMCDAVEDTGYKHNGADLTNFLLPSWFNAFGKPPFDYLGQLTEPFTMTKGGYMIVRSGGTISQKTAEQMPDWRKGAHARARFLGAV